MFKTYVIFLSSTYRPTHGSFLTNFFSLLRISSFIIFCLWSGYVSSFYISTFYELRIHVASILSCRLYMYQVPTQCKATEYITVF